ncbi:MAG TPA: hypothetical protein VGW38_28605 [Chloroflexota bacterium]|nr:hypothetical protein [Chloroflexota bacterium]
MTGDSAFEECYPALSRWVQGAGWLEVGRVDWSRSLIRALDEGGLIWEGGETAPTVSAALAEAESALTAWFDENLGDR